MTCCWSKLAALTPLLDTEVELRDVKWWDHHPGTVVMSYYENSGLYTSRVRQAAFLGGRPGFIGPDTRIDGVNLRKTNVRLDMWESIVSALGDVLFHGPFLRREQLFSGGHFGVVDFMRTIKTSSTGGLLPVLFVLVPGLFYQPVHVGDDMLGGSPQAPEFPQHGQFVLNSIEQQVPEERSLERQWRDTSDNDDTLDAWVARENAKVQNNPSTSGIAGYRVEEVDIYFEDIAAFGGQYGSVSNFYRAFGGQRLQIRIDVTRPAHDVFRRPPVAVRILEFDIGERSTIWPLPVVYADLNAWDTARGLNRAPGEPLPNLPSQAYMTSLAHAAVEYAGTDNIPLWFNENMQPDAGVMYLWVNGERLLYDGTLDRDWVSFFRDKMQFVNVQEYSPPSAFVDFQQQHLPVGYLAYSSAIEAEDMEVASRQSEEVPDVN